MPGGGEAGEAHCGFRDVHPIGPPLLSNHSVALSVCQDSANCVVLFS
tara:strand:- start:561 stop:701 length:141 start_codon:yes stop_codon:yes gene_type:complete